MNEPFSIVPPPELRRQWLDNDHFPMVTGTHELLSITKDRLNSVMDQAAQWGADQELEACLKHLFQRGFSDADILCLRAARRPKPPSLKVQALAALEVIPKLVGFESERDAIRHALEALSND
jgi:hypothetical protein